MKVAVLVVVAFLIKEGEAVAYGATCTKDTECEANKNLQCRKPFDGCQKGYCLCSDDAVEWTANGCVLEYRSNGEACADKDGFMCNAVAGLECASKKCACAAGTWDTSSKVCNDNGSTNMLVKASAASCTAQQVCVAQSGKTTSCASSQSCACAAAYKFKDGACVMKYSNYDGACEADGDCAESYSMKIEGETAVSVDTNFKCKTKKCKCEDSDPTYVMSMESSQGFCKQNNGTKAVNAACTTSNECSGNTICGKCPGDAAGKCLQDNSGAGQITVSMLLVAILCLISSKF